MTKQEKIFESSNVWSSIAAMALPAMASMVVMIFYNIADMFFVSFLGDTVQVAAVSVASPALSVIMALGTMLGVGGSSLSARTFGAGEGEQMKIYSSVCCYGGILIGILVCAALLLFRVPLLHFLGANEEMWSYAETYLCIIAAGAPVMIFSMALSFLLRAEGAVKEGMIGNLISTVMNILLDPMFILGLGMGVGGAAVATVLGNAVGAVYLIRYILRHNSGLSLSLKWALKRPAALGAVIALGMPNALSTFLSSFASSFANRLLVQYGTNAVAAMGAAGKATMVIGMIQMGLCMGVQPLMAYHYGARNFKRLRELLTRLTLLTVIIGGTLTMVCLFGSGAIVALFLKEEEARLLGQQMVRLLVISGPFLGLYYIGANFLQAAGNAKLSSIVSVLRQGVFLIPLLYVMNGLFGVTGNIWAHIAADIASAAVSVIVALYHYRRL